MSDSTLLEATYRPELVFGLVGPIGTRLGDLGKELRTSLENFGYRAYGIKVSSLLPKFPLWRDANNKGEDVRIAHAQDIANQLRAKAVDGSVLARAAIAEIRSQRKALTGDADRAASATAYIIDQLKHPEEVHMLRQVYGPAFFLVAGHATRDARALHLAKVMAASVDKPGQENGYLSAANEAIERDQKSGDLGQNVRDTYPLADVFINMNVERGEYDVQRFVDLLFAHPFHTPTPDEYSMYQASSVALRSSDRNRQVGAAIVDIVLDHEGAVSNADILAVGMNEVSHGGGGFYWDKASPDARDQRLEANNQDRASAIKRSLLNELIERMREINWIGPGAGNGDSIELARNLLPKLKGTQFLNIGEFSRPVHAEMAAIIDAARRGVAIDKRSMYVTTFPCHNCTKHIVAAGLKRVVYLEPYPKSRAKELYEEELVIESAEGIEQPGKVVFVAFHGVGPRAYRMLFSMSERGERQGLTINAWSQSKRTLVTHYVSQDLWRGYVVTEREATTPLKTLGYS